jgi:hypothetical protein
MFSLYDEKWHSWNSLVLLVGTVIGMVTFEIITDKCMMWVQTGKEKWVKTIERIVSGSFLLLSEIVLFLNNCVISKERQLQKMKFTDLTQVDKTKRGFAIEQSKEFLKEETKNKNLERKHRFVYHEDRDTENFIINLKVLVNIKYIYI